MKIIRILCGIPCSGKTTYAKIEESKFRSSVLIISRDTIRENNFTKFGAYFYSNKNESFVTSIFNQRLDKHIYDYSSYRRNIAILDNTFCKEKYIDEIITKYGDKCNIEIKFFDISLIKAHYRNIIRKFRTGKWIPIKVLNQFYQNYNKINRDKYKKYIIK